MKQSIATTKKMVATMMTLAALLMAVTNLTGAQAQTASEYEVYEGPVTEIAVRRIAEAQTLDSFATLRDAFVALLKDQPGVATDREFAAFLSLSTLAAPEPAVFIGMTEYENLDAFMAAGQALGDSPEAEAFFGSFKPEVFTALRPLNPADHYDLATIATEPGQVLEIAVRDFSTYGNFDTSDYEAKRDVFLPALAGQPGFIAEYQWVSVLDPNIAVGMTVYENAEAFQTIATSDFITNTAYTDMLSAYPPLVSYVSSDARAQTTPATTVEMNLPVMEIAIRQVKEGQEEAFFSARAAFIEALKTQKGVEMDWEFQSFFTMPLPNETDVYVGMTRYESLEAVAAISADLIATDAAQNFFSTFDMQAFVLVQPADGSAFNLEGIITEPGQVLEVAVRNPKAGTEDQFTALRQGFFDRVAAQPGYIMDKEFIDLQSGANVVLIVWESLEDFQAALGVLSQQPEMSAFFDILDVQAYQALQLTTNE